MSDFDARKPADDVAPQTAETANGDAAPENSLESQYEAKEREAADLKDKLLRVLAEMENLRRRTAREVADARAYGISGFARDILNVADNMRRALEAVPAELRASRDAAALLEGVELTERELLKALEKNGVKRFDPLGEKFDPNLHQAMFEIPDETKPAGTVAQVVQSGFMIGDRILRPAMVGISKGGVRTAPGSATNAPANSNDASA